MSSVYRTAEGNLVLYTQEERVYLRTLVKEGIGRAVVLASDYASDLSEVLHQGMVYYAYKNTEGEILVRTISDHGVWYRLGEEGGLEGYSPRLTIAGNRLALFYAIKNPLDGQYYLRCRIPEGTDRENSFYGIFERWGSIGTEAPKIQVMGCGNGGLLGLDPEKMIWWDEEGNGTGISKGYSIEGEKAEELRKKLDERMETRLVQARKLWELENEQKVCEIKEMYQMRLDQKDQLIESIKKQYEELMQVAESYRQEAIKWCGKFLS